jgi:hypothetical protein
MDSGKGVGSGVYVVRVLSGVREVAGCFVWEEEDGVAVAFCEVQLLNSNKNVNMI